ncbi:MULTISPECIES: hypothetical protein [Propionibacteriales]|uniref:Uncharacterized protein n=1 Tax=Kribbella ginsengisoli TaxID=363865 RepID=A0ABP6ZDT1_9ACTN
MITETPEYLAAREMNADGFIRHGLSNAAPGTRVLRGDQVGVIALLTGRGVDVVWLDGDRTSRRAATRALKAYREGHKVAELSVPLAGLVALDGLVDPNAERCVITDPYHGGMCKALPAGL